MAGKKVFKWILSTSWLEGRTVLCKSGMSHRAHTQLQQRSQTFSQAINAPSWPCPLP